MKRRRPSDGGFTLVELLVVMLIIGLGTLATVPTVSSWLRPTGEGNPVDYLLNALASARDKTIRTRQSIEIELDTERSELRIVNGMRIYAGGNTISVRGPHNSGADQPTKLRCRFAPDGSGCNMKMTVGSAGKEWRLSIDPITGRIELVSVS